VSSSRTITAIANLRRFGEIIRLLTNPSDPLYRLNWHLNRRLFQMEGHLATPEAELLRQLLTDNVWVRHIAEIGFNGGHSAVNFLGVRSDIKVVSFDLGEHDYVEDARKFVEQTFPGRHKLILGDSRITVPTYSAEGHEPFDLILIDGGHDYEVAAADLRNARSLARTGTLVVMDDIVPWKSFGQGPAQVWQKAVSADLMIHRYFVRNGVKVVSADGCDSDRVMALGLYNFNNLRLDFPADSV
jgi:predicted O-methyltransferase YrrM